MLVTPHPLLVAIHEVVAERGASVLGVVSNTLHLCDTLLDGEHTYPKHLGSRPLILTDYPSLWVHHPWLTVPYYFVYPISLLLRGPYSDYNHDL